MAGDNLLLGGCVTNNVNSIVGSYVMAVPKSSLSTIAWYQSVINGGVQVHIRNIDVEFERNLIVAAGVSWGSIGGQPHAGNGDLYVARLQLSTGRILQHRMFGTSAFESLFGVSIDSRRDAVYVTGAMGAALNGTLLVSTPYDSMTVRLSLTDLSMQWVAATGGPGDDFPYSQAIDPYTGNIFVTGFLSGAMAATSRIQSTFYGVQDITLTMIAPNGTVMFSKVFGTAGSDDTRGIVFSPSGSLVIGGQLNGVAAVLVYGKTRPSI